MKPLEFVGSSREDLRSFPAEARRAAGFELSFVQQGLVPTDWKPLNEVGSGAIEIRIHALGEWARPVRRQVRRGRIRPACI